jgi:hypothetical protein
MFRTLRLLMILVLPAIMMGVPLGLMLGNYARGEAAIVGYDGSAPPELGANERSASSADALQPAAVAYTQRDRYSDAAAHWIN